MAEEKTDIKNLQTIIDSLKNSTHFGDNTLSTTHISYLPLDRYLKYEKFIELPFSI